MKDKEQQSDLELWPHELNSMKTLYSLKKTTFPSLITIKQRCCEKRLDNTWEKMIRLFVCLGSYFSVKNCSRIERHHHCLKGFIFWHISGNHYHRTVKVLHHATPTVTSVNTCNDHLWGNVTLKCWELLAVELSIWSVFELGKIFTATPTPNFC